MLPRRVLVRGPSMSPTLSDGDVVLAWSVLRPRPGDVALVRWAARPEQLSVKRLAGRAPGGGGDVRQGWDVRGDFPDGSTDSRTLGPATVVAVVAARLHPRPRRLRGG
ncbi:S26 family signal peptidase [Rhodococcus aerolatus]